ncbi:unnamed protein product [Vitrella brassicaformis CCMP3155]|uniref:ADP-ribosylation factor-like protein 2 n=1 Tax=Vitrella brassicaformis (strain CCMP3155) TaxID=1169540 RepID=A0A0G4F6B5_VITBC|nr:unnamed protein product [Vitrella brassicaformis CCMP3155]|eukprot:CEM07795.1 unnamed protein product [Vitrella brassicaformis CCMP3155]
MVLLKVLRKIKQREKEMRILVLGLDNAGKTTIVKQLNGEDVSTISPTVGFNITTLTHNGYRLHVWDVGGQKSLRSYWRNYFEQTDGLVWVVDSADIHRLNDTRHELHALLKEQRLAGATLLIFANKQDLPGALSAQQITEVLGLESLANRSWSLYPCSALLAEEVGGLLAGMDWLVKDIASRIYMLQ